MQIETTEESIRQLRLNLDAGLWVTPDRIRALLGAFDRERAAVTELAPACSGLLKRAEAAEAALRQANAELQEYLKLGKLATDLTTTVLKQMAPGAIVPLESVAMKDPSFDHPHEDEHHMIDFGHDTVHPEAAGA